MPAVSDRIGEVIGGCYRVLRPIGHGSHGSVYEAEQVAGPNVALKVLRNRSGEAIERRRFEREGALLVALEHPNVVRLFDYGYEGEEPYLVFELLDGRTLGHELARVGFMSASRIAHIARQILAALHETHGRGIVHRDIKPHNVHLCLSDAVVDDVKVLDYGVAKAVYDDLEKLTEPGMMVGTPGYMAPEQIRGGEVRPATDLFALGVLMAELSTGRVLMGATLLEVCRVHMRPGPFPVPRAAGLSELGPVIVRALEKRPQDRYRSASEMRDAIDAAMRGVDSSPRSASGTVLMPEHLDSDASPSSTIPLEDMPWLRR